MKLGEREVPLTFLGLATYAACSLVSMATMSIGAAIVIAGALADRGPKAFFAELKHLASEQRIRIYLAASGAVIIACFASLVSARAFPLTFGHEPLEFSWLRDLGKMWYFAFPLFLLLAWRRLPLERQACVLKTWIVAFSILSCVGVLQFFTGFPRALPNWQTPGRFLPVLFLGHHLSVASIWIFPFFASLELLIEPKLRERVRLPIWLAGAAALCGLFTLVCSYSRTLWIGLPVGLGAWFLLRLPRKTSLIALGSLLAAGAAFYMTPFVQNRLQSAGLDERMRLWKANIEFFKLRPWFGVGFGKNQPLSYNYFRMIDPGENWYFIGHAHNIYLEVLAGTGLLGAAAWLFWISGPVRDSIRTARTRYPLAFPGAALAAWIVFLINGATQVNFWEGKVLHQVMWMTALGLLWATAPSSEAAR